MAKRIIWTSQADQIFTKILEFYIKRNGTKTYSRRLNNKVISIINILSKQPYLGKQTDIKYIRVFITGDFKIFYHIEIDNIIIHLVWDCRQNHELIGIKLEP